MIKTYKVRVSTKSGEGSVILTSKMQTKEEILYDLKAKLLKVYASADYVSHEEVLQ